MTTEQIKQTAKDKYPYPECNQWGGVPPEYIRDCETVDKERKAFTAGAEWMGEALKGGEGWISVEERLPRSSEKVLAYDANWTDHPFTATYSPDTAWFDVEIGMCHPGLAPTHWMPLPAKPKK